MLKDIIKKNHNSLFILSYVMEVHDTQIPDKKGIFLEFIVPLEIWIEVYVSNFQANAFFIATVHLVKDPANTTDKENNGITCT